MPNQQQIFDIFGLSSELSEPIVSLETNCSGLIYLESIDIFNSKIHRKFESFSIKSWFPALKESSLRHLFSTFNCVIITSNRKDAGTFNPIFIQLTNEKGFRNFSFQSMCFTLSLSENFLKNVFNLTS